MSEPPVFDLPSDDEVLVATLERLRLGVMAHPVAARAIFAALVREGRRFAATSDGAALASRLSESPRFARVRHTWNATTSWLTEGAADDPTLPSTLVDALLAVSAAEHGPQLIEQLVSRGGTTGERR